MKLTIFESNGYKIAELVKGIIINTPEDALDIMAAAAEQEARQR